MNIGDMNIGENNIILLDQSVKLKEFNLIYCNNRDIMDEYLRVLSTLLNLPLFNIYNSFSELEHLKNTKIFKYYYNKFTGKNEVEIKNINDYKYYIISLILSYGFLKDKTVLLDGLCWSCLENEDKINILNNVSNSINGVVLTTNDEKIVDLVKKKVKSYNLINL